MLVKKKSYKVYQGFRSGSEQQMIQNIFLKTQIWYY